MSQAQRHINGRVVSATEIRRMLGAWRTVGRHGAEDLAAAIETLIRRGVLLPGSLLPAYRRLAAELDCNHKLVAAAIRRLREQRLIVTHPGAGTWIVPDTPEASPAVSRVRRI